MSCPGEPSPAATIADGIRRIADTMVELNASGLKRSALVVLLKSKTGLPGRDIMAVLENLDTIAEDWTNP